MKLGSSLSVGAVLMICGAAQAADPIRFDTDIRRCVASYSGNGSGSTWQDRPVPFEAFEGGATMEATNGLETWLSNSLQQSQLDDRSMSFEGAGTGLAVGVPLSAPLVSQGQSKFDMYFSVDVPTEFVLSGRVAESGHQDSFGLIRLSRVGAETVEQIQSTVNGSETFQRTGTLQPGNYRLYAEATGRGRTGPLQLVSTGSAACAFQFNAGVDFFDPADWNQDGDVNTVDFFNFLFDFDLGEADFNRSGDTNTEDLFGFLSAFHR